MQIKLYNNTTNTPQEEQIIKARYAKDTDCVLIHCDSDIVTLGVMLKVLQDKFDEAVDSLSPEIAQDLKIAIERAVA